MDEKYDNDNTQMQIRKFLKQVGVGSHQIIENELNEAKSLKEEALEELRKSLQTQKQVSEEAENIIREAKETAKVIQEEAYTRS